jgi:hypothetical protein
MSGVSTPRRGVRGFALAWTAITLLTGAATFVAIYTATGAVASSTSNNTGRALTPAALAVVPVNTAQSATQSVTDVPTLGAIASNTPLPTLADTVVAAAPQDTSVTAAQPASAPQAVALQVTVTPIPGAATVAPAAPVAVTATPVVAAVSTIPAIQDTAFNLGIQVQDNADPKTYDLWMQMVGPQLKLGWLKSQVRWADLEKTKGQIDFGTLDVILPLAAQYHTKVMLSVVTAPAWAREKGADLTKNGPPADPQDYVNFVTAIVKRYPGKVHALEIWNEQNLDREWASIKGLQASQYVALLGATYKAVKAIDPNIVVISGALSPTSTSNPPKWYDDYVYLDLLIKAGMLNTVDCVGAHHNGINLPPDVDWQQAPLSPKGQRSKFRGPYDNPHHEWSFKSTLEEYHRQIVAAKGTQSLCVTEFGWASMEGIKTADGKQAPSPVGFEFAADNTLADQAQYIDTAINEMQTWGWVRLAFIWNLNYGAQIGWDPKNDNVPYSILGPGFSQRPVWQLIVNRDFVDKPRTAAP